MTIISDRYNGQRRYLFTIAIIAALGGLLFGYDTGIIAGAIIFITPLFHINAWMQGLLVSVMIIGAFIGSLTSGHLVDRYGSHHILRWMAAIFLFGAIITAIAPNITTIMIGRFILGIAVGVTSFLSPLFIAEMAPANERGKLVLLNGLMITSGEAIAFLIDYYLLPTQSWRFMFATCGIPAIALLIGTIFLPRSPRWLILQGNIAEARKVLGKIRPHQENVEVEIQQILTQVKLEKSHWRELFSDNIRPALIIGLTLGIAQQFCGINAVMYYGPSMFAAMGFQTNQDQLLATFILGCVNTIITLMTILTVDHFGRRTMMITGLTIATLSLISAGLMIKSGAFGSALLLISMITYIIGYSMSLGSLFWLIISEIFPLNMRGLGMSAATASQWGANIIISMSFLTILQTAGIANTFWLFSLVCIFSLAFTYWYIPETKGISLEQIEHNLRSGRFTNLADNHTTQSI
jgi:SP family galactose:H+ symporter-like MFS transporter